MVYFNIVGKGYVHPLAKIYCTTKDDYNESSWQNRLQHEFISIKNVVWFIIDLRVTSL